MTGKKKVVLVLSAGTATAWSICCAIRKIGEKCIDLIACDMNPGRLVHTSVIADSFIQVPPIGSPGYYDHMLKIFENNNVNIVIPLIEMDIQLFSRDNGDLSRMGIMSTAPDAAVFHTLSDKYELSRFLIKRNIPTPKIYQSDETEPNTDYFVKPRIGFGSRGVKVVSGYEAGSVDTEKYLIQELCFPPEITADIFTNNGYVEVVCRERIETKAGVCTKARVFYDATIKSMIQKISNELALPNASCAQFMKSRSAEWMLTDFNLRPGAGSAISSAAGFDLTGSAAAVWLGRPEMISVSVPETDRYVARHYSEVLTE